MPQLNKNYQVLINLIIKSIEWVQLDQLTLRVYWIEIGLLSFVFFLTAGGGGSQTTFNVSLGGEIDMFGIKVLYDKRVYQKV